MSLLLLFPAASQSFEATIAVTAPLSVVAGTLVETFVASAAATSPLATVSLTAVERFEAVVAIASRLSTVSATAVETFASAAAVTSPMSQVSVTAHNASAPPVASGGAWGRRRGRMGRAWRLPVSPTPPNEATVSIVTPMAHVSSVVTVVPRPSVVEVVTRAPLTRVEAAVLVAAPARVPVVPPAAEAVVPIPARVLDPPDVSAPQPIHTMASMIVAPRGQVQGAVDVVAPPAITAAAEVTSPMPRVQLALVVSNRLSAPAPPNPVLTPALALALVEAAA